MRPEDFRRENSPGRARNSQLCSWFFEVGEPGISPQPLHLKEHYNDSPMGRFQKGCVRRLEAGLQREHQLTERSAPSKGLQFSSSKSAKCNLAFRYSENSRLPATSLACMETTHALISIKTWKIITLYAWCG